MPSLDFLELSVNVYALLLSVLAAILSTGKIRHSWRTRHLRKVWGIRNGDSAILVCSELDDPTRLQHPEPREFIYNLKYGDVDAYFETVVTLLRLYPAIKLRVMSAGEAESTRLDLARHLILIGGPDYNALVERVLSWKVTHFDYRSPYTEVKSAGYPNEIAIYDTRAQKEMCYETDTRDCGYFERIVNPHNADSRIILIGGCHTIGVTGAVKAFSMADCVEGEISRTVLRNASVVAKRAKKSKALSVLVQVERVGQTISVPNVLDQDINVPQK